MKSSWLNLIILCGLLLTLAGSVGAGAQSPHPQASLSTAFTYQGHLAENGAFANGTYDFRFILYDAQVGGSQAGDIVTQDDLTVIDGLFTVVLDFGTGALDGDARYLEIAVREGSSTGNYTTLSPRQMLAAAPYASYAASAPWGGLTNVPTGLNDGDDDILGGLACAGDQVAKWNGSGWACANDDGGPSYTAGTGLSLEGNEFRVVTSIIQRRVTTDCGAGAAISRINQDGSVVCETDDDALGGLVCTGDQVAKWNGSGWACAADDSGTYSAGNQIVLVGTRIDVNEGADSGLDADLLDGEQGNFYQSATNINDGTLDNARFSAHSNLGAENYLGNADGDLAQNNSILQSTLNADLLDGHQGSFYQSASNIDAGTLNNERFSAFSDLGAEGYLGDAAGDLALNNGTVQNNLNADLLDGHQGSFYQSATNIIAGTLSNARFSAHSDLGAEGYLGDADGDLAQNNGTVQNNLNADQLDDYHATQLAPVGAFSGGDQSLPLSSSPTIVISVTIEAPSAGVIIVTASGTAGFNGGTLDMIGCSITTGTSIDTGYLTNASDFGAAATPTQFTPFASTRGYSVASGIHTYNLVCNASLGSVVVQDTSMSALFTPETFAGTSSRQVR